MATLQPTYDLPPLPPPADFDTVAILRALANAHRHLAEMKGRAVAVPNPGVLIDTLSLQEARASSEIENIITTQDELFQATLFPVPQDTAAKEVARYGEALRRGFVEMQEKDLLLTNNLLVELYRALILRTDGFRVIAGTALFNEASGEVVYVPPQDAGEIVRHMTALERFINDDDACDFDPLIKMAIIHHQFESIHPFSDGNGRVGRILNVLYLVRSDLLDLPILYLSGAINRSKDEYYRLLQAVRDEGAWEEWVLYVLGAVAETAQATLRLISGIGDQMVEMKHEMRERLPRVYSQDLLNNLFRHPYTKIDYVQRDLQVARQTAARYLDQLTAQGFVTKYRLGRGNYYINHRLAALLAAAAEEG